MNTQASLLMLALEGVGRMREKSIDVRGRAAALPLLLRGAYYSGEDKWRACAEEDLRALWRGGVHDHIGGGFFSAAPDREWLRPVFEKRLDDNALLACLYAEAWEKGRMPFYRAAAEEALDFCVRDLAAPSGLYRAGLRLSPEAGENPFLFRPAQVAEALGDEAGRHFAACYDLSDEPNCGEGSIPNLILNERWNLIPEGYDDLRERLRLWREERGGLAADERTPLGANALLLAALARAGRVFADRRYLAAASALAEGLCGSGGLSAADRAALLFALTELYAAELAPARIAAAAGLAPDPDSLSAAESFRPEDDRALSLAALGFDALWRLTGEKAWLRQETALLSALSLHPERHGPESLAALCTPLAAAREPRTLLCVSPGEETPAALRALTARYAPDLCVLLKTPGRAAALAAAAPWTAAAEIGGETLFYPVEDGKIGAPHRL